MKKSVVAVALALSSAQFAQAQVAPAAEPAVQKVVVTGSNIKRGIDQETSSPVQVITRQEIVAIGASTVKDILDTLTSNTGALSDVSSGSSFASGASGVSLRNLGKSSTLTLLNGRRVANYGLADGGQETFVNIDSLPAEIVDRIEVLLDGASAIYGSDAVAGVINVITKREFRGAAVKAGLRQSLNNSNINKDQTASVTVGAGDLGSDGYNVFGHLEAFHRNPYSDRAVAQNVPKWYVEHRNPSFGVKSTYSYPGNYVGKYPSVYPTNPALAGKSFTTPAAGCAPENIEDGLCKFDQWDRVGINAEAKRYNFFGGGRLNLSNTLSAFSEITYSDTTTTFYNAPQILQSSAAPSKWYSAKDNKLLTFSDPKLPVGHPNNPYTFPVELRYRFADDVSMFKNAAQSKQYRVLAGLDGSNFGWDWNTAIGAMGSKVENSVRGKHAATFLDAVLSGKYKFGGQNSPELLNGMFPNGVFGGESKQTFIDAKATRELMQLPGGPLSLAVGGDFRVDSFSSYVSDNIANAELVGYGSISVSGSRHLSSAYAELNAPVTKAWEINGAVRADKSGDADVNFVPKLGMRYEVNKSILLRGTVAAGFRAPNVAETGNVAKSAFLNGVNDPKRCATATAMYDILKTGTALDKADSLRVRDSLGCLVSVASFVQGNPELQPEKSKSLNLGLVLSPMKDLTISLDYYRIERRNEIGTKDTDQILANEDSLPGSVVRSAVSDDDKRVAARVKELSGKDINFAVGAPASIAKRYENMNKTQVSGLDLEVSHRLNLGSSGTISTNIKANYQLDYRSWDSVINDLSENLVGTYANYRYQVRAASSWSQGPWSVGAAMTFLPGTSLNTDKYDSAYSAKGCDTSGIDADDCKIKSDYLVDMNLSYTGFKNSTVMLNVDNVFNRASVVNMRASTSTPPLRGRILRVAYQYKF